MPLDQLKRREFITILGGAVAWPLVAHAQQSVLPVIGFLSGSSATGRTQAVTALREGLKEAGFVDGTNVRIEFRWADLQYDRLPALAADLVQQKVAIIITTRRWLRRQPPRRSQSSLSMGPIQSRPA
jgi:putative ABC transport system substrate-binding protein